MPLATRALLIALGAGLAAACASRSSIRPEVSLPEPSTEGPGATAQASAAATPAPTALPEAPESVPAAEPTAAAEAPDFADTVVPILMRNCSPCHAPGGRMYERLPFDKAEVVRESRAGIARRLKDPDDKQILERWWDLDRKDLRVP